MRHSSFASSLTRRGSRRHTDAPAPASRPLATRGARGRLAFRFLYLLLATFIFADSISAKENSAQDSSKIRVCGIPDHGATTTPVRPAKRKKGGKTQPSPDYANTCLEVRASGLDVQELLQQFVRKQRWPIEGEDITGMLWSFNLPLSKDELLSYAKPGVGTERVNWQGGKAVVLVSTFDLGDGYTRTTVSAQFKGFGELNDTFAIKPAFWTLTSTGKLEARLTGELQAHFYPSP